jgi:pilus assembly protein CpaE
MSRIVLATASVDLRQRMHQATNGEFLSLFGPLPPDPAHVFAQIEQSTPPKVVVLDASVEPEAGLELAARFDAQCPAISVILVTESASEVSRAAMRAGVRDILHPAADISDIRQVLDRALQAAVDRAAALDATRATQAAKDAAAKTGRVITIVSPKGGVGKTTVATNVAVGLARAVPNSTVLVDLDVQFGDVASALDLEPEYSLPDAVHGPASRDPMVLKTFLTRHETGLYVICGPRTPADAEGISGQDVGRLLQTLASEFRYVVVDTAPGLSDHALAALDQTTDLVLLTSMDVPGIRGLRKELDTLTQLGLAPNSRHVVLNFIDTRAGLSIADVEATIGTRIDVRLSRSKAILASVNQGLPLLQNGARDTTAKQLRGLVTRFTPAPIPQAKPQGASRKTTKVAAAAPKPKPKRASRKAAKAAAAAEPQPRRAAGHWSRGRWVGAS